MDYFLIFVFLYFPFQNLKFKVFYFLSHKKKLNSTQNIFF